MEMFESKIAFVSLLLSVITTNLLIFLSKKMSLPISPFAPTPSTILIQTNTHYACPSLITPINKHTIKKKNST